MATNRKIRKPARTALPRAVAAPRPRATMTKAAPKGSSSSPAHSAPMRKPLARERAIPGGRGASGAAAGQGSAGAAPHRRSAAAALPRPAPRAKAGAASGVPGAPVAKAPVTAGAPGPKAAGVPGAPGGAPAAAPAPAPRPMGDTVLLKVEGGVATLTLNRPEQRNAISPAMIDDLEIAVAALSKGPARVVILTGSGPAFCAGMDLGALKATAEQSRQKHEAESRRLAHLFRSLYSLPRPTIAAVNGPAIAGGCGLATLCDFVLAVPDAAFGYPEVRIGFIPALVAAFLERQIGDRRTRELLLSARVVRAEEALRLGLITEVASPDNLLRRAREIANTLLTHSPASLTETKALLNELPGLDLNQALDAATRASARMRQTPDFKEGLAAFLEKRKPVWRSK